MSSLASTNKVNYIFRSLIGQFEQSRAREEAQEFLFLMKKNVLILI